MKEGESKGQSEEPDEEKDGESKTEAEQEDDGPEGSKLLIPSTVCVDGHSTRYMKQSTLTGVTEGEGKHT